MAKAKTAGRLSLVIFAKNMQRVSTFYERTLDLVVSERESSHYLLQGVGIELVIHSIPTKYASQIEITEPPQSRDQTSFKPAFLVKDLEFVRAAATETGGYLKPAAGAWQIRGAIVLDGWDPEGNVVQFKQSEI